MIKSEKEDFLLFWHNLAPQNPPSGNTCTHKFAFWHVLAQHFFIKKHHIQRLLSYTPPLIARKYQNHETKTLFFRAILSFHHPKFQLSTARPTSRQTKSRFRIPASQSTSPNILILIYPEYDKLTPEVRKCKKNHFISSPSGAPKTL